ARAGSGRRWRRQWSSKRVLLSLNQLLSQHLQQLSFASNLVEVVAPKRLPVEGRCRMARPGIQLPSTGFGIVRAAKRGDRAVQWPLVLVQVGVAEGQVRAQNGQQQLHQLGMLK